MERTAVTDCIHVEQLEVFGRVGVTENERAKPQRLTLTITVWPEGAFDNLQDDITRTIDYSGMCMSVRNFVAEHAPKLVETLAGQLAAHLLNGFPIQKIRIELCKFVLPDAKHVAVVVMREK